MVARVAPSSSKRRFTASARVRSPSPQTSFRSLFLILSASSATRSSRPRITTSTP